MGKKNKGKKKGGGLDFDDFFRPGGGAKEDGGETAGGWQTGSASAMMLDDEGPSTAAAAAVTPAAAAAPMDTAERPSGKGKKPRGGAATAPTPKRSLGVSVGSMKRGARTAVQKQRRMRKMDKALARVDKQGTKAQAFASKLELRTSLKHLY